MAILTEKTVSFEYVTLDRAGALVCRTPGQARVAVEDLGHGTLLELVAVPGGSFQMGSRHEGGYEDERPVHPVFLEPFWLGRGAVTQAQWQAVMGRLPGCRFHGADLPVEGICWKDAVEFCARLAKKTARPYTLPSEAQWEYACRAGTSTPFSLGETITTDYVNYVGDHTFRDEPPGIYRHTPIPAGTFPPNPWGLYDMHGGLWELCADAWHPDYSGAPVDGSPRSIGWQPEKQPRYRAARGGSWHETPAHCRSAVRLQVEETDRAEYYGLRVLLKAL